MSQPAMRIVGAEWAAKMYGPAGPPPNVPGLGGITRYPCPICGHPTGDCAPEHEEAAVAGRPRKATAKQEEPLAPPPVAKKPAAPKGFSTVAGSDELVTADDDVYVEFVPAMAITKSRVLLFHKGEVIPRALYEQRLALYKDAEGFETK